jgi:ribosomal subunit interface protein
MNIDITGHQIDITDALKQRVEVAAERLKAQEENAIQHLHVVLESNKKAHRCDIQARTDHGTFVAKDSCDDMYTAIDRSINKIEKQMQSSRGRELSRRTR